VPAPEVVLYGPSRSRASRSLIALEELGVAYRHEPLFVTRDSPEARATLDRLNPNSHVPVLDDGGFILWESMAINLYLAERHGGPPLWPGSPRERGLVYQWSFWSQTEIDRPDWDQARRSGDDARIAEVRRQKIARLGVLDRALSGRAWLVGDSFSFADLNVAATLSEPHEGGRIDWQRLDPFEIGLPALGDWLKRCTSRESWRKVREL
jgi:glutathione S-transferase